MSLFHLFEILQSWPPPTPLPSIAPLRDCWFAVGALAPREGSLQQRNLLSVRNSCSFARYFSFTCSAVMSVSLAIRRLLRSVIRTAVSCDRASYSDAFFLAFHSGVPTLLKSAYASCEASELLSPGNVALSLFDFDLASCFVVSGHHSTETCAQGSTGLHVWWSLLALSLSLTRVTSTSGIAFSAAFNDCSS